MATYYWVGGTGTWNASSTTPWASSSGASGGAGFPTSADDVIFDNNSNVGTGLFTVTATSAVCNNISFGTGASALDGAMTLNITSLSIFGNCTLPSTNLTVSGSVLTFAATTTGKTITSNGTSFGSPQIIFNGVGGGWTLQDNLTNKVCSFVHVTNYIGRPCTSLCLLDKNKELDFCQKHLIKKQKTYSTIGKTCQFIITQLSNKGLKCSNFCLEKIKKSRFE